MPFLINSLEERKNESNYICHNCKKTYKTQQTLRRHVYHECGQDPKFQCAYCPKKFKRRDQIQTHMHVTHFEYFKFKY